MKKKSTSQSTFSNIGVFTGLLVVPVALFLLVAGLSSNASARVGSNTGFAQGDAPLLVGQKVTASDGTTGDEFGYRVALAEATLVVGAFTATVNGNTSQGAAYVFTKSNNIWSESQKLTANDGGLFDNFGAAVALDGATLVVAANGATVGGNPAQGAVYVFTASNGIWMQTQKLTAND